MVGQELFAKSVEMKAMFLLSSHLILFLLSDWSWSPLELQCQLLENVLDLCADIFLFLSLFMFVVYENGHCK